MTRDEALARQDLAMLLETIGRVRGLAPRGKAYPCPSVQHDQTGGTPPCEVRNAGDPYDLWVCHACGAGGTAIDALIASGMEPDMPTALKSLGIEEDPPVKMPEEPARQVDWYDYVDEDGEKLFQVVRLEPKSFRQRRWEDGRWQWGLGDTRRVLYRLPQLKAALARNDVVFVVEGEKDVHAVEAAGQVATTCAGGAGKWLDEYTEVFPTGARVVLLADDDEAGRAGAAVIYQKLFGRVARVVQRLPAVGFNDIYDHLAAGRTMRELRPMPTAAPAAPPGYENAGAQMFTARVFASRPSLGKRLQVVGPMIQRGMRTTIGAQIGHGKTSLSLQAIRCLVEREPFLDETWRPQVAGRALIIDLEQGEEAIKRRLGDNGLTGSDAVDILWEPNGLSLESDAEHQALVRDTIASGSYDLVLMDPLYQMHQGSENDQQLAARLMRLVDGWARELNFALVIPMHARKPDPRAPATMTMNEIAGSTTWNRNAEFVFGLQILSHGFSKLWTFKDRIGDGPRLLSWWGLVFEQETGFARNHQEDTQRKSREAEAEVVALLERAEGATMEEIEALGATKLAVKRSLKAAHDNGAGRFRTRPWTEQVGMNLDDGS